MGYFILSPGIFHKKSDWKIFIQRTAAYSSRWDRICYTMISPLVICTWRPRSPWSCHHACIILVLWWGYTKLFVLNPVWHDGIFHTQGNQTCLNVFKKMSKCSRNRIFLPNSIHQNVCQISIQLASSIQKLLLLCQHPLTKDWANY